ncbi:iron-containing alcohol dehydrogenase [Arabiibacter massiliensis]|uniref:iron-containing alcohol dehydrogenase n=1 Tax=Arabiibacter massiliensis TaxID=1870985 RepID=UPI0009BAD8FF|nr:iron-containing alcohol dehydrogenase [Arabiibacter massiliensis]
MLGNFTYDNPTRLHFGPDALERLRDELPKFGRVVQLAYGGGSIKKSGLYDQVTAILEECGRTVVDDGGVMPNPTSEKLAEGVRIARDNNVDFILAVGGGSVVDYAKAVSVSVHCDEDPWERYYLRFDDVECDIVPVGCVLTMAGTGSEMNGGAVITNHDQKLKIGHVFGPEVFPKFAILNPELTFTVPKYQMAAGIFDVMSHVMEQYFSGVDDNVTDYLMEGLMRSLVASSRAAVADPRDYEARSNIMWAATWALNTLFAMGKATDWEVHMIGQAVGAYTDATHGMTLSAVSPAYYRLVAPYGLPKFARFARTVWDVEADGRTDEELAEAGIAALEAWAREIGCVMSLRELGVDEGMLDGIAEATLPMEGGYHPLSRDEVVEVLRASL